MIIALFIFTILNYYTFAFDLPEWFMVVSLIAQLGCVITAAIIWEDTKADLLELKLKLKERNNKK